MCAGAAGAAAGMIGNPCEVSTLCLSDRSDEMDRSCLYECARMEQNLRRLSIGTTTALMVYTRSSIEKD